MKIFAYIFLNLYLFMISALVIYSNLQNGKSLYITIIASVAFILVVNICVYFLYKGIEKLIDYIFKKNEERRMKKYNLFEWIGESNRIKLYDNLLAIKQFNKRDIHSNIEKIKEEINKEFNSLNKLNSLKLFLEVKVESPKLTTANSAFQTIIIALITFSLVSFFNKFNYLYLAIFYIVFIILIVIINEMSKEIDRYKFLFKIVIECIKEENTKKNHIYIN